MNWNNIIISAIFFLCSYFVGQAQSNKDSSSQIIFDHVETEADFPGGAQAFMYFVKNNLKYPEKELSFEIEGRCVIEFVIDSEGKFSQYRVVESAGSPFDREALRVLVKMPKWKPASINGQAVSMYYSIPINFSLGSQEELLSNNEHIRTAQSFKLRWGYLNQSRSYNHYATLSFDQQQFKEEVIKMFLKEKISFETEASFAFKVSADGKIKNVVAIKNSIPNYSEKLIKWIEGLTVKSVAEDNGIKYDTDLFITIGFSSEETKALIKTLSN